MEKRLDCLHCFGCRAIDNVTATSYLKGTELQQDRIRTERSVCFKGDLCCGNEGGNGKLTFSRTPDLPCHMLEVLNCLGQVKAPASLAIDGLYAMRGQIRSAGGNFSVAKQSESDPVGCPCSLEKDFCSSTSEPPTEIFPSVSWVEEFDDAEAKATTSVGVAKSLMKCPYSRKRLKCRGMLRSAAVTRLYDLERTTTTATTKKKRRKPGKDPSEDDPPECLPYIIIG
jgi:hypothetical protein